MAIIKCPECQNEVSDRAVACPHCGFPLEATKLSETPKAEEIKTKEEADRLERERQAQQRRIAKKKASPKQKKVVAVAMTIIVACIAFVIVLTTIIIPKQKLNKAISLLESGDYQAAFTMLDGLDYKYREMLLSKAQVGSYVLFGSYEQDNNTSNGKEDIEWLVLAKEADRILLTSRYALDSQKCDSSFGLYTYKWESCSLRTWLNGTFLSTAFSAEERGMIPSVTVVAEKNPKYGSMLNPGNSTTDQVFLLSITELKEYFTGYAGKCQGTAYCYAQGAHEDSKSGNCCWLLRTPGNTNYGAALVNYEGVIYGYDIACVVEYSVAVRPAMWISLEP